jgi:hypothetical protein
MGSCGEGKRLSSTLNTAWATGDLYPRSRMGVNEWKLLRENTRVKGILAKLFQLIFAED